MSNVNECGRLQLMSNVNERGRLRLLSNVNENSGAGEMMELGWHFTLSFTPLIYSFIYSVIYF